MKLDGAFKPQGAFPYVVESSIGAKNRKYRDKFYSNNHHNNNSVICVNNIDNSNKTNSNNNTKNKKYTIDTLFIKCSSSNYSNSKSNNTDFNLFNQKLFVFKQSANITYKNSIKTNNNYCNNIFLSDNANAKNINKIFNENITQSKNIKGFKQSFQVDNSSSNNNNNNNKKNRFCSTSSKKVTKTLILKNFIKYQMLPVLTSGLETSLVIARKSIIKSMLYDSQKYRENFNKIKKTISEISYQQIFDLTSFKMRSIQSSIKSFVYLAAHGGRIFNSISFLHYFLSILCILLAILPNSVKCDESDFFSFNSYSLSPDSSQPDFDYASRGQKYFGDKCDNTLQCGFPGSICDAKKKTCRCTEDLPITNHIDKCGRSASHNESCFFNEQCEAFSFQTECRDARCICKFELQPVYNNGNFECGAKQPKTRELPGIDPAMIFVLVGMALMFIIICVVLRLFSQARWRENRTIFNTPNPRLMNVSLLRESKLLHGQERRGSRMSVRGPSRQPSMASLRPHSPNPSLASRNSNSNGSVASIRSRCDSVAAGSIKGHHPHHQHHGNRKNSQPSNQQTPLITHVTPNPAAESVTVEIIEPTTKTTSNHTDI